MQSEWPTRLLCAVCRGWFPPHPSATKTQKTCSIACRRRRRNHQARQRRGRDLGAYRAAEKARQQQSRATRAAPATVRMSRAGLGPEMGAVLGEYLEKLDQVFRQSRATFERALIRMIADSRISLAACGAPPVAQGEAGA